MLSANIEKLLREELESHAKKNLLELVTNNLPANVIGECCGDSGHRLDVICYPQNIHWQESRKLRAKVVEVLMQKHLPETISKIAHQLYGNESVFSMIVKLREEVTELREEVTILKTGFSDLDDRILKLQQRHQPTKKID